MANLTPTAGNFYMFMDKTSPVEDNSLESAIRLTIPSGSRPARIQNFVTLISSIPNYDLINSSYGTKGAVPNSMGQLRGFPVPTVTMNYAVVEVGTSPASRYEYFQCNPVLNNIVGFDITITVSVSEVDDTFTEVAYNEYSFVFLKGSTSPSSVTIPSDGTGKWKLNSVSPDASTDIQVLSSISSGSTLYYSDSVATYQTLTYYPALVVYSHDLYAYTGTPCGGTLGSLVDTVYSTSNFLSNGDVVYANNDLTGTVTGGWYGYNLISPPVEHDYFELVSNVVTNYGNCT